MRLLLWATILAMVIPSLGGAETGHPSIAGALTAAHRAHETSVEPWSLPASDRHPSSEERSRGIPQHTSGPPQGHLGAPQYLDSSLASRFCYGVWPSLGGQALYGDDCYGHDEPGFSAYSPTPGSGGNLTWSFVLPVGRSPTQNQSDLYGLFWIGMMLSDPVAATRQCYLELQFIPDRSFTNPNPVVGNWIAQARVTQIDPATDRLDPCFFAPIRISGGSFLNMAPADRILVNFTGWAGRSAGEHIVVRDLTSNVSGAVDLYNVTGRYALDPAYNSNSFHNALEWTNTGALPVSFAFEVGHADNGAFPSNSSFDGCTPGAPPPTARNPSVPCPSYDPGSWTNDTTSPIEISLPSFQGPGGPSTPSEVTFTDSVGGPAAPDLLSNGTCAGREGTAYCSNPWFSYSCSQGAFEFGATDWADTSVDFGKYNEYSGQVVYNAEGSGFDPGRSFPVPACGAPASSVGLAASPLDGGQLQFLGRNVTTLLNFSRLLPGDYALAAEPSTGEEFADWNWSGAVSISAPFSPWTNVRVTGNGTVVAEFRSSVPTVHLTFRVGSGAGRLQIAPGFTESFPSETATVSNGSTVDLLPGPYSIEALPGVGYRFAQWAATEPGGFVAAPALTFTWLVLTGDSAAVNLTANFSSSAGVSAVTLILTGGGHVVLNGVNYSGISFVNLTVGSYGLATYAPPGGAVDYAFTGGVAQSIDRRNATNVTLDHGIAHLIVAFLEDSQLTLQDSPTAGAISFDLGTPSASGTVVPVLQVVPASYPVLPVPPAGYAFSGWSTAPSSALSVDTPSDSVLVNSSGTLLANFAPSAGHNLTVQVTPAGGGAVLIGPALQFSNSSSVVSMTPGTYSLKAAPATGYQFAGWQEFGSASVVPGTFGTAWPVGDDRLVLGSGDATLRATFVRATYPVTLVVSPIGSIVRIDGTSYPDGSTPSLPMGSHSIEAIMPSGGIVGGWTCSPGLALTGTPGNYTLVVQGPGTAYGFGTGAYDAAVVPSALEGVVPFDVRLLAIGLNSTPPYTVRWSFGDGSTGSGSNVTHAFLVPGPTIVSAWINDSHGHSALRSITLNPLPPELIAFIGANVSTGPAPLFVQFNSTVEGGAPPYSMTWNYSDGGPGDTNGTPSHEFAAPGNYTVQFVVSDPFDQVYSAVLVIDVGNYPAISVALTATPDRLTSGAHLVMTAIPEGAQAPIHYTWSGLPTECPAADQPVIECNPTHAGSYTVGVVVEDGYYRRASNATLVEVRIPPPGAPATASNGIGLPILIAGATILGIALIGAIWLFARRRNTREPPRGPTS